MGKFEAGVALEEVDEEGDLFSYGTCVSDGVVGEICVAEKSNFVANQSISAMRAVKRVFRNLLLELGQCFAADAVATFPVHLGVCKENCSARQCAFLQDPSAATERTPEDIPLKIVGDSRDTDIAHLDAWRLLIVQKAIRGTLRITGGQYTVRAAEGCLHFVCLLVEIAVRTL